MGGDDGAQTYILLSNPGSTAGTATLTFLRTDGTTVVKTVDVPAASRITFGVTGPAGAAPELVNEVVRHADRIDAADHRRAIALQQRQRRHLGGRHQCHRNGAARAALRAYFKDSRCRIARSSASSSEPRMNSIFSSIVARCPGESDVCGSTC